MPVFPIFGWIRRALTKGDNMFWNKKFAATILLLWLTTISLLSAQTAIDSLKQRIAADPGNPSLFNDLADALLPDSILTSRRHANRALTLAREKGDLNEQARAKFAIGNTWWYAQDFEEAIRWFASSATTWEKAGNLLDAANAYNDMAYTCNQVNRYDQALVAYRKALALLLQIDDEENLPAVLINIGQVHSALGNTDSAIHYNSYAAGLSDMPGHEEELSAAMSNLGFIYKNRGDFEKAIGYYNRSLAISKKMNQKSWMATDLNNIANVYTYWEKYEPARLHLLRSIAIDRELNDRASLEVALNNLAYVYQQMGNLDSAMVLYKKSAEIAADLGRVGNVAIRKINIGMLYYHLGNLDLAADYVKQGLATNRELGIRFSVAGALQNLGAIYLAKNDLAAARRYLDEALRLARDLDARIILEKVYDSRSKLFEKLGNYSKSLNSYRQYVALKDSLFNKKSQEKLAEMQARYESEKKQQRIELLMKDNELHKTRLRKKQVTLVALIGGIVILGLSSLIIIWLYVQKSRANRKLVEKNLELMNQEPADPALPAESENRNHVRDEERLRILEQLEMLMNQQKIFTHRQLTLTDLADRLNTNTAYLSRIINEHYGINFSNYINGYRVREVQKMFAKDQHHNMTLEGIAESVGFQSRSTFNTAFKKHSGVTPSVFIKNLDQLRHHHDA